MSRPLRTIARIAMPAALLGALPGLARAETATVAPLPASEYAVRPACSAARPGRAACLALQLVPVGIEAQRHTHLIGMLARSGRARPAVPSPKTGELGLRPQDLHSAYSLPTEAPSAQTIALIDAYTDPTAEADLKTYSEEFGLPACTAENGCFKQVSQSSGSPLPFPKTLKELEEAFASGVKAKKEEAEEAAGWGVETSLDIESAHATCQSCKILLVEANSQELSDLTAAVARAEELGATEISNSWGAPEESFSTAAATHLPYADPGTVITASAGDSGYRNWDNEFGEPLWTSFPAASPSVVAVGGTRLAPLGIGGAWTGESVWNGSGAGGGGCSVQFSAPAWQQAASDWSSVGCGTFRSVSDVSAVADPYTGVVVRDTDDPGEACETKYREGGTTHKLPGWCTYGGTSLSSPIVAAVYALAGGANGRSYPAQTLYETERYAPGMLHDVTSGSNGECGLGFAEATGLSNCSASSEAAASCASKLACLAGKGYDGPSGVGTPKGALGFTPGQREAGAGEEPEAVEEPASTPVAAVAAAKPPAAVPSAPPPTPEVSALRLLTASVIALSRRPSAAKVAFSFSENVPARILVTLSRKVRSHGRTRWVPVGRAIAMSAAVGANRGRLAGARRLPRGTYRLTLAPSGGKPRSVLFSIG